MKVYVDSSVLLRVVLGEPNRLRRFRRLGVPIASELIRLECLRTIDRARLRLGLDDEEVADRRAAVLDWLEAFELISLDTVVLARAAEPFPTLVRSLDAIHLASALLALPLVGEMRFATHDGELATAARAVGFQVLGVA